MRRKYLGLAIAAITAFGPASAFGSDREIAEQIMTRLKSNRDSGALKDFTLDMKVDQGTVLFRGSVSESAQKQLVLKAAEGIEGINNVVDEVSVQAAKPEAVVAKPQPTKVSVAEQGSSLRDMITKANPVTETKPVSEAKPAPAQLIAKAKPPWSWPLAEYSRQLPWNWQHRLRKPRTNKWLRES